MYCTTNPKHERNICPTFQKGVFQCFRGHYLKQLLRSRVWCNLQFYKYLEENVTNCAFYYIVSLERNTKQIEGVLKIGIPHGTKRSPSYICPPSYDSLPEALIFIVLFHFCLLCEEQKHQKRFEYTPLTFSEVALLVKINKLRTLTLSKKLVFLITRHKILILG